jgi:prephenate dehydrogenase (NADP+)
VRLTARLVPMLICVATKLGAIVGGQTSCKAPEMAAFEKHLPKDVEIISCHSLHGPGVNSKGQPLVTPR